MKIIVDAFGGDNAPLEILKGCAMAVKEYNVEIIVTGDEDDIKRVAHENTIDLTGMTLAHSDGVIPVEESSVEILKKYENCSMAKGFKLLAEGEGDAFVTAGSTGAAVVGGTFLVKRIKGVKRAAIATVIPNSKSAYILLDAGANHECRPDMLMQFGVMGACYMNKIMGIAQPRVGLVNIGAEETKGPSLVQEAYGLLKQSGVNFVGNIEAREIPLGACDVAVCDGFTGNIVLKLTEGMAKFFSAELKYMLTGTIITKIAAGLLMGAIKGFKQKMDYTEYGGAPILGLQKPVIKAHGSSNAKALKNAIGQAVKMCGGDVIGQIQEALQDYSKPAQK